MNRLLRRLYPDRLGGQIAFLILASIILFHLIWAAFHQVGDAHWRLPSVEPSELTASAILAIDAASVSERHQLLASLLDAAPWMRFSVVNSLPDAAVKNEAATEVQDLKSRLWRNAEVFLGGVPGDDSFSVTITALRKGGYAIARTLEPRRSSRHETGLGSSRGASLFPPLRILERSGLFFLFSASILVFWVSSAVVSPLVKLAREAERFPDETKDQGFVTEIGPKEVRNLAKTLNRMQLRIRTMMEARSQALAGISHDLRTIITRIQLRSEFIKDDTLKSKLIQDANAMDAMLRKNLQYLRDEPHVPERCLLDLDSVLQTVSDQFADIGYAVTFNGGERPVVHGDFLDIQRIFNNLIENAAKYGRNVNVTAAYMSGAIVRIDIADDGPGIPSENKAQVLKPFVRGEPGRTISDRSGFGLGLSIVSSLVEDLGGTLELLDNVPRGLIARVLLPAARAAQYSQGPNPLGDQAVDLRKGNR